MESLGAFVYTENVLKQLSEQIREKIKELGGNEKLSQLLEFLEQNKN